MKLPNKNYVYIALLALITLIFTVIFGNYFPMPFVDIGREVLVPQMMLEGDLIYRDILNIYGAMPYYALAIFYKLFGANLITFLSFNAINAFLILCGIYLLSCEFLSKDKSFILALCISYLTMTTAALYSFIRPYSICFTVALCAFIFSVLFLIKFLKKEKDIFLYFSLILAGFVFATKNDLCLLIVAIFFTLVLYKKLTLKRLCLGTLAFLFFPIVQYQILLINGLKFDDLIFAITTILKSAIVPSMTRFHRTIGMLPVNDFSYTKILSTVYLIVFILIGKFLILKQDKKTTKIGYIIFTVFVILFTLISSLRRIFWPLPIFTTILIILNFKQLYKKPQLLFLGLCAIVASLKTYFSLMFSCYGGYTIILLAIFLLSYIAWKNKLFAKKIATMILIMFTLTFAIDVWSFCNIKLKKYKFENYEIKLLPNDYIIFEAVASWINKNTQKTDKILIYPEGEMINFVTKRKTHPMLYNLHDINIETFGLDYIQKEMSKMDYIIDVSDLQFCGSALSELTYNTPLLHNLSKKDFKPIFVIPFYSTKEGHGTIKIYKHL